MLRRKVGKHGEKGQGWCLIFTVMENDLLERRNGLKSHVRNFSLDLMKMYRVSCITGESVYWYKHLGKQICSI